ncbi:transposase [Halorussus sp. AFM4]|uniref:transposase n=1 Tax=Halorussus sp. AFM4 TaxID=3421651 RepID=UPI003EB70D31
MSYEMEALFRLFLLKECYGWDYETAPVEYLTKHPDLCERIGLESVPDQSTLWRSWHHRFTTELQNTVETTARTALLKSSTANRF